MALHAIEFDVRVRPLTSTESVVRKVTVTIEASDDEDAVSRFASTIEMQAKRDWAPPPPKFGVKNP